MNIKRSCKDQGKEAFIIINPNIFSGLSPYLRVVNKILLDFCMLMCSDDTLSC